MRRPFLPVALPAMLVALAATTARGADEVGPGVRSEALDPGLRINGVPLSVTRLSGSGLPAFVARTTALWQANGARWADEGAWQILSRRVGRWSEVLQVRRGAPSDEALLSRVDMDAVPAAVPRLSLRLPAGCHAMSTVESGGAGERVMQVAARCTGRAEGVRDALQREARISDWRAAGTGRDGGSLHFLRGDADLGIVVGDTDRGAGSWVVALERHQVGVLQ